MLYPIATLETAKLDAIKQLESEIGTPVIALCKLETDTVPLSKEELQRLQMLENELDVVLVAVKPH